MLPIVALTVVVIFFIMLRTGFLDDLPELLRGDRPPSPAPKKPSRKRLTDRSEDEERLDVFKKFFEGREDSEEE